jgi:hypothetical protein
MKKMKNADGQVLNVVEHWIAKNFWEYYVTDDVFNEDIVRALVMGFETEIGDVSRSELRPYLISKTKNMSDVMPASGWQWVEV